MSRFFWEWQLNPTRQLHPFCYAFLIDTVDLVCIVCLGVGWLMVAFSHRWEDPFAKLVWNGLGKKLEGWIVSWRSQMNYSMDSILLVSSVHISQGHITSFTPIYVNSQVLSSNAILQIASSYSWMMTAGYLWVLIEESACLDCFTSPATPSSFSWSAWNQHSFSPSLPIVPSWPSVN